MLENHLHGKDNLLRYVFDELEADERKALERHLDGCTDCREFVTFVKTFNRGLRESVTPQAQGDTCPDTFLIAALESKALDELTAAHVRSHVLFCETCLEDFLSLRRLTREQARESIPASWLETIERFKQYVIDLSTVYRVGTRLGAATVLGEGPALAFRGEGGAPSYSKVLGISVGENIYSVEISRARGGDLTIDVVGSQIRQRTPLAVVLRAETGEELAAANTDKFGNGQLSIPDTDPVDGLFVLCAALGRSQEYFIFRLPDSDMG